MYIFCLTGDINGTKSDVAKNSNADVATGAKIDGTANYGIHHCGGGLGKGIVNLKNLPRNTRKSFSQSRSNSCFKRHKIK